MAATIAGCDKGACVAPLLFVWLCRRRCHCVAADAPAAPGCGLPRPRDGQEGRFRTASLHPPAAPKLTTINIWLMFCRAHRQDLKRNMMK